MTESTTVQVRYTADEWRAEATRRFGADAKQWRFVCPSCGHIASVQDWKNAGASSGEAAYSCVGRALGVTTRMFPKNGGPCNYAGGGLFGLNPVVVIQDDGSEVHLFDFAPETSTPPEKKP